MTRTIRKQAGSVSLFVVIFAALLILIIGTAFIRIMLQDQKQATANDLSRSALDSAYAGVEDTKRLIVAYYADGCNEPTNNTPVCSARRGALIASDPAAGGWTTNCAAVPNLLNIPHVADMGYLVQESTNNALDQAYTCIKVQMAPPNYVGSLTPNTSRVIKLQTDGVDPKRIQIDWYAMKDTDPDPNVDDGTVTPYRLLDPWPANRPPVIRAQLLQYRNNFSLSEFNDSPEHNATLFLMPAALTFPDPVFFPAVAPNGSPAGQTGYAQNVKCAKPTAGTDRYACSVIINLPAVDTSVPQPNVRTAYLKISQFYSAANTEFRITMLDAASPDPLHFKDVQPVVDSTGRANDLFRRIQSRIDIGTGNIPNPESAVDVTKSLCKIFAVTDSKIEPDSLYMNGTTCPKLPT